MNRRIYVGNLSFATNESSLSELFGQCGKVEMCRISTEPDTKQSKGFAFLEMSSFEEAERAIKSLNGAKLDGREIRVSEARPQASRSGFTGSRGGTYDRSRVDSGRKRHFRGSF